MNKTFKVVFNKARGALMVVNEATSSVQKKGTKTVIAAAVTAMIAGSAMANTEPSRVLTDDYVLTSSDALLVDQSWPSNANNIDKNSKFGIAVTNGNSEPYTVRFAEEIDENNSLNLKFKDYNSTDSYFGIVLNNKSNLLFSPKVNISIEEGSDKTGANTFRGIRNRGGGDLIFSNDVTIDMSRKGSSAGFMCGVDQRGLAGAESITKFNGENRPFAVLSG